MLLDVKPVTTQEEQEEIKRRAMSLPTTLAAFVGCSGRSVKLLVRVARADGSLPQEEYEADAFYTAAYEQLLPIYSALVRPYPIEAYEDGMKHSFLMPLDTLPRTNFTAVPFIATTNQSDVLADPSGSRRFIGILIDGDIDTHQKPNYTQLFAQALAELENGERYWFDNKESEAIILHNRRFQLQSDALTYFYEYFETANTEDEDTEWLTAAALLEDIKSRARGLLKAPSLNKFARELHSLPDIRMKATRTSKMYLVRRR